MKNALLVTLVLMTTQFASAHVDPSISKGKIAELSAHRADRLVALGKIDGSFVKNVQKIEVVEVQNAAPVSYKVLVSQVQPQAGTPMQLELQFDHDGKPLSFKVLAGGTAGAMTQWPSKSAGELIENGMHYILENTSSATIAPYFKDFSNLVLLKGSLAGTDVALIQVSAQNQTKKLNIFVNLDGTMNSAVLEP